MPAPTLPNPIPPNKIRLYCVGIFFYNDIDFVADPTIQGDPGVAYMKGAAVLEQAAALGLRYSTGKTSGHVDFLSFTPLTTSPRRHPTEPVAFPYLGLPLSLQEVQSPIGSISNIFQYTCSKPVATPLVQNAQFAVNGFEGASEIRIRLLSIYDSASLYDKNDPSLQPSDARLSSASRHRPFQDRVDRAHCSETRLAPPKPAPPNAGTA